MMNADTIRIILGAWLRGEHLEDVKQIPVGEFGEYGGIASAIRAGEEDPIRIARKANVPIVEVARMRDAVYENLYQSAMRQVIERNRVDWIREHPDADPEDLIRVIEDSRRAWMVEAEKPTELSDIMLEYFNELDNRRNQRTLLTGIDALDEMTGGICPGTLTAVGARPSTGKSAFCLQVAVRVASAGAKVLFFSLEMSDAQNMDRLMLMHAHGFSQKELRSGNLKPEQWDAIRDAASRIEELNGNLTFMQTRSLSAIEELIRKEEPDLVVIDQLTQLQEPTMSFSDVRSRFSYMTSNLKRISMEQNTAIWLACQLNRAVNGAAKPSMDNLKESGSIEEDSDNVILLSRDEEEEEARNMQGNRVINVQLEKQRSGETGEFQLQFFVQRFGFKALDEIPPSGFQDRREDDEPF